MQELHNRKEQAQKASAQAEGALDTAQQAFREAYTNLVKALAARMEKVDDFWDTTIAPVEADDETVRTTLRQLMNFRASLEKDLNQAQKTINQHNALCTHLDTINALSKTIAAKHSLYLRLQTMLNIVEEERKRHVQETVDKISETVRQLYHRIHPDEPLGNPSFNLKPNFRSSLTLTSTFGNKNDIPPNAYYSEAHLDTLGICIYLALAKQSGNAVVVLDNVLMSIDDPHLDRIIELLNDEVAAFGHVLITTHSRLWFERMRLDKKMPAQLIELHGWSLEDGIRYREAN